MTPEPSPVTGRSGVESEQAHPAPTTGGTRPPGEMSPGPGPTVLSRQEMHREVEAGRAELLSPLISDYIHHQGDWWIADTDRWLRIEDRPLHALLNAYRQRLAAGLYGPE